MPKSTAMVISWLVLLTVTSLIVAVAAAQTTENQLAELRKCARNAGCSVPQIMSAASSADVA
jgi:hypothetical protein